MKSKRCTALLCLFVLGLLALPNPASACTMKCQRLEGGPLFCRECVDTGSFTGAACDSNGPCSCFYVQVLCDGPMAAAETSLPTASFLEPEADQCTAETVAD